MAALLALDDVGRGDPLILLHGIATDRHIWDLVVPELASDRRVVTLDLPGFGGSAPVGEDFDLERVAERIVHGLTGRGIHGPLDLVGHSLGGGIAITLATVHPRLVRRLVLVAPAGLRPFPATVSNVLAAAADAVLAARRGAASLTEVSWGRKLLLSLTAADGAEVPPTLARQLVEASATAQRTPAALATITSADLRPLLAELRMPLGVIWGEVDRTVPIRALDELLKARPDAQVSRIANTGHVPMVECPERFVTALRPLIQDVTNSAAESTILQ
jgi:pimeloyl-ACP methyl ester carboxylesterase